MLAASPLPADIMKGMKLVGTLILALPLMAQQTPPDAGGQPIPLSAPASSVVDPAKVVLQVGDIKITAQQLDALIDVYPVSTQVFLRGPGKQQFADTVVRMLVLSEEARKRKLDESQKFKDQRRFSEDNILSALANEQIVQEVKPEEAALRAYFDEHRCEFQTWHARQILVRGEGSSLALKAGEKALTDEEAKDKANELRRQLIMGSDFATLARAESDDTASGANGGDLGTIRHGQVLPSIEETVCKMNPGEISDLVKSPFGYHVLRLDSKEVKTFDEVKDQIDQRLRPELTKKAIDALIGRVKVTKDPEYYAPEKPAEISTSGPKKP
jgi:peptidyl-prolyl cis-trans isomerase C